MSGGCADLLTYMSKALPCGQVQSQHRLSDKLSALAKHELSERAERSQMTTRSAFEPECHHPARV